MVEYIYKIDRLTPYEIRQVLQYVLLRKDNAVERPSPMIANHS
jgi:hypothetical protein